MTVPPGCPLTARQFEIVGLLADGLAPKSIATRLGITHNTVRTTIGNAARTLKVSGAAGLITEAGRRGWLNWTEPEEATPLAVEHPFLAAYLREFEASRWPREPDARSTLGMHLALTGHRNRMEG